MEGDTTGRTDTTMNPNDHIGNEYDAMTGDQQERHEAANIHCSDQSGSDRLAERIIGGIECEFRDWLSPDEYAQAKRIIKQIIESEYQSQNSEH